MTCNGVILQFGGTFMHIGISRPPVPPYPIPDIDGALVASMAETLGFECIVYGEHPVRPVHAAGFGVHTGGVPHFQDLLVMMARASAMTSRIKIGSAVLLVIAHNPLLLAKQLACIDQYSAGRLLLGIGTGGSPMEIGVLGGDPKRPWAQTSEAVRIMKCLWTQEYVEFHGEFYDIPPVQSYPRPAQQPHPPILMGSKSDRGFARMAQYCDGWMPAFVTPDEIANGAQEILKGKKRIQEEANGVGRDSTSFPISVILRGVVTRDVLKTYEDAGVERVLISLPQVEDAAGARTALDRLAASVL
jgi:probable F420-dependent oxidoreductase